MPAGVEPVACRLSPAVDQILALTFTRKAALEMKERIARRLVEQGFIEERRRLEVGYISTIHTFCERVLRENPFEAGLDPDFAVLDEPEAALLLAQAYEQVLEQAFARDGDPVAELADACFDRRTQDGDGIAHLQEDLVGRMRSLASLGWSPGDVTDWAREPLEEFLERSVGFLVEQLDSVTTVFQSGIALLDGLTLGRGQMEEHRKQLVERASGLGQLEALARRSCLATEVTAAEARSRPSATPAGAGREGVLGASAAPASVAGAPEEIEAQLRLLGELRPLLVSRKTKEMDQQAFEVAREQFEAMKAAYEKIEPWAAGWTADGERRVQQLARAGLELLARLWSRYEGLKRERAALDINDLQRLTRDLLRDSPTVRARLRARLSYVMVDEFQDTDRLQVEILDLLRVPRRLFFVGDVKQSIYRFRNADVQLFIERERAIREAEVKEPGSARRLGLAVNFRSRPEILAFVNGLFERLWAGLPWPYEPLTPGRGFEEKAIPAIDLLPISSEAGADAVRRAAARAVARRVSELMANGVPLTRRDHSERGQPLRPRHFVLLLRSLTNVHLYEQALEEAGLPTFVVGGRSYYARREVRDVVNLLKTIRHPLDDLAVASTLRSPFAGVSLDTLTLLAIQARTEPAEHRCLYGAIRPALESQPIEPEDIERLRGFPALIDRLREQEDRLGVGLILEIVLAETEYAVEVLRRRGGRRTLANIRKLQQMANRSAGGGVGEFVERIEALTRVNEREGDAPTHAETADVVRLMTIHQAKGLEFPVVVLPDLGYRPRSPQPPLLALDPDRRLAAFRGEDGDAPALHHARAAAEREAELAESVRLLYVALTRAEEHLILAGPHPGRPGSWAHQLWPHVPLDGVGTGCCRVDLFDGQVGATVLRGLE